MKRNHLTLFIVIVFSILTFSIIEAFGRGGGGRGGGGRGGGGRGGGGLARTPSMNGNFSARQGSFNRDQARGQAQQYMQRSGIDRQGLGQNRISYQDLQNRSPLERQATRQTLDRLNVSHPEMRNWFNNQFYDRHNYGADFLRSNANWWAASSWYGVNDWVSGDWTAPLYYSYPEGQGQPVSIQVNNYPTQMTQQPATTQSAQGKPAGPPSDWIPIGIFAAGKDVAEAAYSNMFVMLALNKQGDIEGVYYNAATDQIHPIDGSIDKQAQVAAWNMADNPSSPIMQTGLYNLSQAETPVQVHFPDDTSQTWFLVKLQEKPS